MWKFFKTEKKRLPASDDFEENVKLLNNCDNLFLRFIGEPRDNKLRLVVEEARAQAHTIVNLNDEHNQEIAELLKDTTPIESDSACRLFELVYDNYIQYLVTNEIYGNYPSDPEKFTGNLFRIFQWSYLLEFIKKSIGSVVAQFEIRLTSSSIVHG